MIEPDHPRLSIVRQCELAAISRSSFYRAPTVENEATLRLMIGHMQAEGHLGRCYLKGRTGDAANTIPLSATTSNASSLC